MSFKKNFGLRLKTLRKQKGYSQEKFSEMIGVAQNTLSNIENGVHFCSSDTIDNILNALETTPKNLFDFGYTDQKLKLLDEIIDILVENPNKIQDVLKITKALIL